MPVGFYELLQVPPDASPEKVRAAWQEQVAQVVRKLRAAEARQQDTAAIESRRQALSEAWSVLSDPARRRRYDRFRELSRLGLPADPEELWREANRSLVDPAAAAALDVVRLATDLRVGDSLLGTPGGEPPTVPTLPTAPVPAGGPAPAASAAIVPPPSEDTGLVGNPMPAPNRRAPVAPGHPELPLDRTVSGENLARLFEQYGPSGAYLGAVRQLRRVSLDELSATTRVSRRFLEAMERDAYTELPGATFVRGYVRMVLKALEALDGPDLDEFVDGFMSRFHRARG